MAVPYRRLARGATAAFSATLLIGALIPAAQARDAKYSPKPVFSSAVAFDVSRPLSELAHERVAPTDIEFEEDEEITAPLDHGFSGDSVVQSSLPASPSIAGTSANFEGLSNQDNFNIFGGRVNPPDPVGDVGPNHYVEMVNLVFAVYDKTGNLLLGPVDTGTLWDGFADRGLHRSVRRPGRALRPVRRSLAADAVHDARPRDPSLPFYNCVAISTTGDPTGAYYRYAFITQPDTLPAGTSSPTTRSTASGRIRTCMTTRDFGSRRRVRHQRLRAREEQDGRRQPEGPRRAVLPRLERGAAQT